MAGLSARVSYRHITTFSNVVHALGALSEQDLRSLSDARFLELVRPLGMGRARLAFWTGIRDLADRHDLTELANWPNDALISLLSSSVEGAGYKVAQSMVVCLKGYYSGVFIVDSGLKDLFSRCVGLPFRPGAVGHEDLRHQYEAFVKSIPLSSVTPLVWSPQLYEEILRSGLGATVWFAHLLLVYFKRLYCNPARVQECPIAAKVAPNCGRACLHRGERARRAVNT